MTEAEIRSTYEKKLKAHPALAEAARLRELARRDVMDQLRGELGADVRQPVPARTELSRLKNRLLQNAAPTRQSIRNERLRMCAKRPWLERYPHKVENLIRLYRKREALDQVLNEEGVWSGTKHFFAMFINLSKLIQVEERDLALTPVSEIAMRASLVKTDVDLAALLAKAAGGRNGNAIESHAESGSDDEVVP
jgi:hypothetical protein